MHWRQKSSRYCNSVLFLAGLCGVGLVTAIIVADFKPDFEIWLASALVVSLILHARAGFALSRAQQEIELLQRQSSKINKGGKAAPKLPVVVFDNKKDLCKEDTQILDGVKDAIENDRVDLYLQPIVSLPQRKHRYFEAFSRLRNNDGSVLRPVQYLEAAERANKIGVIDNMILLRAVQALRNLGPESQHHRIFCNISPATIFDADFFARFVDYLDANADLAPRLVFEFTYPAVELMNDQVSINLDAIARRGYEFSVDHIRRFDLNWKSLKERNFRFVKVASAKLLAEANGDAAARARAKSFKDRLRENEIDLIVEKVEFEAHVPEILSLGIDYGQGELFGAPRPATFYIPQDLEIAKAS